MALRNLPALAVATQAPVPLPVIPENYTHPGLSIQQVIAILRAFWKQSLAIGAVVFVLIAIAGILKPKTYRATATLLVSYDINDPLGGKEFPLALLGSYLATQIELLSSPVVLMPVVDKLKLNENKKYIAGVKGGPDVLRAAAERAIEKNLVIEQGRNGSQLIYIGFTANSPAEAAEIANTIAEVYTDREYVNSSAPVSERAERYSAQLAELKAKVTHAQDQLTEFRQRTGLIAGDGDADIEMQTLAGLEQRLLEARNARRQAEVFNASKKSDGSQVLGSPVVQGLKTQLTTQLAKMAEMRATDGPKNPRVIELQSQIDSTRKAIDDEVHTFSGNAATELDSARQLEGKLASASEQQRAKVIAQRQLKDEREKYRLDLESAQTAYRRAMDGFDQISREASSKYNNVNFVSRATPPTQASSRRTRVTLMLGMIAGGFLGLAIPLGYGLINRRVRCRDDIERDYGIPVLVEFSAIPA